MLKTLTACLSFPIPTPHTRNFMFVPSSLLRTCTNDSRLWYLNCLSKITWPLLYVSLFLCCSLKMMASNCNVLQPYCIIPKCRQLQDKAAPCPSLDICIYSDAASLLSLLRCIRKISTLCSNKMFGGVCFSFPPLVLKISEGTPDILLFSCQSPKNKQFQNTGSASSPSGLIHIHIHFDATKYCIPRQHQSKLSIGSLKQH